MVGLLRRPDLLAEQIMNFVEGTIPTPVVEVTPDGALGGKVTGQVTPLAPGAEDVEDGVEDVSHGGLAGSATAGVARQERLDQGPLLVGEVAGIVVRVHAQFYATRPLWDRLLVKPPSKLIGYALRDGMI